MDLTLRCNSLKCRAHLTERAVVTTCSHIFCISCSDNLGLSNSSGGVRICPACETHLTNPDDVVATQLNPTEDYKTSVLSGLSPSIIMECAGRGLAFYSYQTTQEIVYQEFLTKSLTERYTTLSSHMDKIIHDANSEITSLRDKLSAVQIEQKNLEQRNDELVTAYREKSKTQQQIQKLYQCLKAQVMQSHVATAASDDAEFTLQSVAGTRFADRLGTRGDEPSPSPQFPIDRQRTGGPINTGDGARGTRPVKTWPNQASGSPIYSTHSAPVAATPSQHRTRLPMPLHINRTTGDLGGDAAGGAQQTPFLRQPLEQLNANSFANTGISGFGMSAGMKIGRQAGGRPNHATPRGGRQSGSSSILMR